MRGLAYAAKGAAVAAFLLALIRARLSERLLSGW
jgi:hypothetical protein